MFTYNLKEIEKKDIAVYGPSRVPEFRLSI